MVRPRMSRSTVALGAALSLVATALVAQSMMDADGDGLVSFEELTDVLPDIDVETFNAIDTYGDGMADPSELAAARDAGLLPMES